MLSGQANLVKQKEQSTCPVCLEQVAREEQGRAQLAEYHRVMAGRWLRRCQCALVQLGLRARCVKFDTLFVPEGKTYPGGLDNRLIGLKA